MNRGVAQGLWVVLGFAILMIFGFSSLGAPFEGAIVATVIILVIALILSLPFIFLARRDPWVKQRTQELERAQAANDRALSEYEAAGFRARRSLFSPGAVVAGTHAGVAFEHYVIPGGKGKLARVAVSISTSAPGTFSVSPEGGGTELVKALGMGVEFQTGDVTLDRNYYFSGSSDEYMDSVFGDRENLRHLRELLALGYSELKKDIESLRVMGVGNHCVPLSKLTTTIETLTAFRLPMDVAEKRARNAK